MKTDNEILALQPYDLDEIQAEFLKYAPAYARREASDALRKVIELQSQGVIRNGIFYIVLVDLCGSTRFSAENGNESMNERIQIFVTQSFQALSASKITNTAIFLKEIGDAVLYVFQHFPDILKWRDNLQKFLDLGQPTSPYVLRTCIHIGEISFNRVNPISLAMSQTFKMEKAVESNDIGLTEPAYHVAYPTIRRASKGFSEYRTVDLDGFIEPVKLYKLNIHDEDDLSRIVLENEKAD